MQILTFVQSRMNVIAPNTCALVGSGIASQLLGLAGGLTALSRIPGCNIAVRAAWAIFNIFESLRFWMKR